MKKTSLIFTAIVACACSAQAKLNVVATLPDSGSLAREIGGDKVDVTVLAKPTEDPHFVDARPSFVVALRNADVLIDGGAELEIGWLPPLLQNARNPKIEAGRPGRVNASQGIRLMNVPTNVTRAAGDVHALGNPHFMTDPIIAKAVAQHIAQACSLSRDNGSSRITIPGHISRTGSELTSIFFSSRNLAFHLRLRISRK